MMWTLLARIGASLLLLTSGSNAAQADIFNAGEFTLTHAQAPGSYEFTAVVPQDTPAGRSPEWPDGCRQVTSSRNALGNRALHAYAITCERELGANDTIRTAWGLDGASLLSNIGGTTVSSSLSARNGSIEIAIAELHGNSRSIAVIAVEYLQQGVAHIWLGWDHLAFVLCLCLLARGRELIWLVTAFTAGHSVSLALAFFELVHVPVPPVEAVIAMSIAFMAREALIRDDRRGTSYKTFQRQLAVVVAFGLLHGLGFASALGELGVRESERVGALVFFNLGVEAGQLMFVAAVTMIMTGLRAVALSTPVRAAALYSVGILGCFWMVERVSGFALA